MSRYEIRKHFGFDAEGITVTVTRKGIEVTGVYDSFAGLAGGVISWEELEEMRRQVEEIRRKSRERENERLHEEAEGA